MKVKAKAVGATGIAVLLALVGVVPEFTEVAKILNKYDLTFSAIIGLGAMALGILNRMKIEKLEDRLAALENPGEDANAH